MATKLRLTSRILNQFPNDREVQRFLENMTAKVVSSETDLSFITVTTAINLDNITVTSAINLDYITVTQNVDLDTMESDIGLNNTHRSSNGSDHTYIDQDVTSGSTPTLVGTNFTGIPNGALTTNPLARANHTGTQTASTISDFDTEVSNNTDVAANTTHRTSTGADHTYINQSVATSASPTFVTLTLTSVPSGATQAAAGAGANELWVTSGHATLPDNVLMLGV